MTEQTLYPGKIDQRALASRYASRPLTAEDTIPAMLASFVSTTPGICGYGENTADPATAAVTPRQHYISDLFDVISDKAWTAEDMKTFVTSLPVAGAKCLGDKRNLDPLDEQTVSTVNNKWHAALNSLGYGGTDINDASIRHRVQLAASKVSSRIANESSCATSTGN